MHIITCIQQTSCPTITGGLISTSLEQLRLEIGVPGFLTYYNYSEVESLLTFCWLQDLWKFLDRFQIKLHDKAGQLSLSLSNHQFLIQAFLRGGYKGKDLRTLNKCRMFVQANTLADIVDAGGTVITQQAWEGKCNHRTGSVLEWPRSPDRLPSAHWTLWKQALTSCFLHRDRQLSQSLGHWIKQPPQRWKWFFSHSEDRLYAKEGWLWRVHPDRYHALAADVEDLATSARNNSSVNPPSTCN
jgi:hypothetical protein